jgi:hypothetical protein
MNYLFCHLIDNYAIAPIEVKVAGLVKRAAIKAPNVRSLKP